MNMKLMEDPRPYLLQCHPNPIDVILADLYERNDSNRRTLKQASHKLKQTERMAENLTHVKNFLFRIENILNNDSADHAWIANEVREAFNIYKKNTDTE